MNILDNGRLYKGHGDQNKSQCSSSVQQSNGSLMVEKSYFRRWFQNCSSEIGQNIDTAVCICSVQQGSLWYVVVPLKSGVRRQQPDQL